MERKVVTAEVKAAGEPGGFSALAAAFGNVDRGGDRILPGAFTNTLARLRDNGDPLPVVLSHRHDDPMAVIGQADPNDVVETDAGLVVNGKLDIKSNPVAKQVHDLMQRRVLKGWSFAFTVAKDGQEVKDGVNEIKEIGDLFETGPTLIGMNPSAQLQAVKALSDASVTLEDATAAITRRQEDELTETPSEDEEQGNTEIEDRTDEEPSPAKSRRQDPLADEIEDLWLATAAVTPGGSNEVAERAAPPRR